MNSQKINPLITIITVVYNGGECIEQSIKSVLSQSYDNIEYIIIDGGSTDKTLSVIEKYKDSIDCLVSEPDEGIYDAMNKGIKHAHGDWIFFLGADDVMLDSVQKFVGYIVDDKAVYYGNVQLLSSGKLSAGRFNLIKLLMRNIPHQGIFYPAIVFENFMFETKYKVVADYVLNLKLYSQKWLRFIYIPVCVSIFNDHGISSYAGDSVFRADSQHIVREYYPVTSKFYYFYKWLLSLFQ